MSVLWVAVAYLLGSVSFVQLAASRCRGVDLREGGTATVSGPGPCPVGGRGR